MKKYFRALLLQALVPFALHGQQKYPALINIISFEELQKKSFERKVEWTNPDGSKEKLAIKEMTIPFTKKLKVLTMEFVHDVYGLDSIWLNPRMIVFHAMGDGDLKTSLEVSSFLNDEMPDAWGNLSKAGKLPNGAHFIIDRDGTIVCLSPPVLKNGLTSFELENHHWYVKRHQDGNPVAIGVENVTPKGNYTDLTEAQIKSNAQLARWLTWFEQGEIKFIASHHQFNDDKNYDRFLNTFQLYNYKKPFRTRARKDIGTRAFSEIFNQVKKPGNPIRPFFDN